MRALDGYKVFMGTCEARPTSELGTSLDGLAKNFGFRFEGHLIRSEDRREELLCGDAEKGPSPLKRAFPRVGEECTLALWKGLNSTDPKKSSQSGPMIVRTLIQEMRRVSLFTLCDRLVDPWDRIIRWQTTLGRSDCKAEPFVRAT
jgi:hypothetical protein